MLKPQRSKTIEILSESNLHLVITKNAENCMRLKSTGKPLQINSGDLQFILIECKKNIERQSVRLIQFASNRLKNPKVRGEYQKLSDPAWELAAKICEIFKHRDITKNKDSLDFCALQEKFYGFLTGSPCNQLVIGWGQPKRMAGGLKTLGEFCDLAEMYTIAKLSIVRKAIAKLTGQPIKLRVLTGGDRFFEALFTRPDLTLAYDLQRQLIADFLNQKQEIIFVPYPHPFKRATASIEQLIRFEKTLSAITDELISSKFDTILLNVDWDHLFCSCTSKRYQKPHGISLSPNVIGWLKGKSNKSCHRMIRKAVIEIILKRYGSKEAVQSFAKNMAHEIAQFMEKITWESTRKYIAIHAMNADDEIADISKSQTDTYLRLTVHKKPYQKTIPAIFALARNAGNQLSQHVSANITESGSISFTNYAKLCLENANHVYLDKNKNYPLFGWLVNVKQPFCFINHDVKEKRQAVKLICQSLSVL